MQDQRKNSFLYAQLYSKLPITGTRYLTFRDVPTLIDTYVTGKKTLDYGCGPGHSTVFLKSLNLQVQGVDISEDMIKVAQNLDPRGTYTVIGSGEVPAKNGYFDLVYAGFVLPYASTKCELLKIVKETARILTSNGIFMAIVPNGKEFYSYPWLVENNNYEENQNIASGSVAVARIGNLLLYHYYWSDKDYRDIFEQAGLKLECAHRPLGNESDGYPWISETKIAPSTIYVARKVDNL